MREISRFIRTLGTEPYEKFIRIYKRTIHGDEITCAIPRRLYIIKYNSNLVDMRNIYYDFFLDDDYTWEQNLERILITKSDFAVLTFFSLWHCDTDSVTLENELKYIRDSIDKKFFINDDDANGINKSLYSIEKTLKEVISPYCCYL